MKKSIIKHFAFIGLVFVLLFSACGEDLKMVSIAIKKGGKVYLFSSSAESYLQMNQTPPVYNYIRVYKKGGKLYTNPPSLEYFVNLIAGNMVLFDHQEKSYDGYVSVGNRKIYKLQANNESTEKIGEQLTIMHAEMIDTNTTKKHEIVWQYTPEIKAEKNCEKKKLWVYGDEPGSITLRGSIVVDLQTIVDFYNNGVTLDYDKSNKIVYIIHKD